MAAFLVPVDAGQVLIPLEKAIVLIGRQADCDVSLTQSRKISRKHCCIAQVNERFVVRDLGSTNGIFLNGTRIEKEADLKLGDDLVIGDVRFRMQDNANLQPKPGSAPNPKPAAKTLGPDSIKKTLSPKPQQFEAPSMDIPIALADEGEDFAVETTNTRHPIIPPAARINDVVPIDDDDEQDDPIIPLASDSF